MPQIIPIRDLRDTTKLSEMCNATDEPIFVTKNGYGDLVVMSVAAYERQLARVDMYNKICEAIAQSDKDELRDGQTVLTELKNKYGL